MQPDLWGVARRDLIDAVRLRKQELEEEGNSVTRRMEIGLWAELAPSVISKIQEKRRGESIQRVNSILAIPTVTTQAEFDALAPGARFIENGVEYKKPLGSAL